MPPAFDLHCHVYLGQTRGPEHSHHIDAAVAAALGDLNCVFVEAHLNEQLADEGFEAIRRHDVEELAQSLAGGLVDLLDATIDT